MVNPRNTAAKKHPGHVAEPVKRAFVQRRRRRRRRRRRGGGGGPARRRRRRRRWRIGR
jgi:hypothetical protein